ncbi:unnamed protein product [Ostreobium quekettii]|uniref:Uncharacterized protein n=1 Tax=Ostreobium quekettii TaxID=121088 RepID=A0A8S1J6A6_9CHLO|nr:unnamed protein product [Ostreobium quekettii]|eukprot:evm.model.scf_1578.3 EVM.evm.TU.scf_1578.3   scf_1578:29943-30410(-)
MRHLTGLTCLEHLEMRALPYVSDVCVEWLAKVTTLVHLELSPLHSGDPFHLGHDYQLTDQGLKHVAQLQALKYLCLEKCGMVSNKGLKYIGKLTGLEYLDISRMSSITSAGLDHLSELRSLRCLVLSGCCNLFHGARDVLVGMGLGSIRLVLDRW